MDLLDEREELKKQLEEALEAEKNEPPEEEVEEEVVVEEPVVEPVEEPKEEPAPKPDSELTSSEFARIRRENAAMKKQLAEREALKAEPVQTIEQPVLPPIMEEIAREYQINQAGVEFNQMEAAFRRQVPDYDDVSNAFKQDLFRSVKLQNPRMSDDLVLKETNKQLLLKASQYVNQGLDPVQEMYEDAKSLGYKARPKEEPKEEKTQIKPDLSKVAENKERNSGMMGAKGAGGQPELTKAGAAAYSPVEWAKLSRDEKNRILGYAD